MLCSSWTFVRVAVLDGFVLCETCGHCYSNDACSKPKFLLMALFGMFNFRRVIMA
jgi:hypothetical protein